MDGPGDLDLVFTGAYNLHNSLMVPLKVDHNKKVFNHLVTLFDSTLRNSSKKVGLKCFEVFGSVVLLVVEIKLEAGNDAERLDAIAQVIAECEGRHQMFFHPLFVY